MKFVISHIGKIYCEQIGIDMLILVEIFTILNQSLFNGIIIKRRTGIGSNRADCPHLGAVIVLQKKLDTLVQGISVLTNVAEDDIEPGADVMPAARVASMPLIICLVVSALFMFFKITSSMASMP